MKWRWLFTTSVLAVTVAGCDRVNSVITQVREKIPFLASQTQASAPDAVAQMFWQSAREGNIEAARTYALESTTAQLMNPDDPSGPTIDDFALQGVEMDGDSSAAVATRVTTGGDQFVTVDFTTHLVLTEADWKVDLDRTGAALMQSILGVSPEQLAQQVGEAITEAVQEEAITEAVQEEAPPPDPAPRTAPAAAAPATQVSFDDFQEEVPWFPTDTGTVNPGMTIDDVVSVWGEPEVERGAGAWTFLFYRNGCERACGTFDVVMFDNGQVVDAIVRGLGHTYSGVSSSPPNRLAEFTPPTVPLDTVGVIG